MCIDLNTRKNPASQDSPPAAGRKVTSSTLPQCDPRGAFYQIGNGASYLIKNKAMVSDMCVGTKGIILQIINTRGINYVASTL